MLQRSEEGDATSSENSTKLLACIEECGKDTDCLAKCYDSEEDTTDNGEVVKSGDLAVSSSAAEYRSVVVTSITGSTAVSDLDTLTFKTSEEVTLSKVVLEKYGYSNSSDLVANVWLEDENGKEISNKATPNTKGLVNLTIKKDYKVVDGTFNAIVVIETNSTVSGAKVGGTIGFKVSDVVSTAKNVDLGNYKAYTYDVVAYDGTEAKITAKGGSKDYNYDGKAVEISKFKIKAPDDSAIVVNSFTLTNSGTLDIYDNIDPDDIEIEVDGKAIKANISINKDEEMSVSLKDSLEIAAKAQVEVIVYATLSSDFEDYGSTILLKVENASDLSATDKNNARITVNTDSAKWVEYEINGGEVKIVNTKLGNVEASINSTDILIASGYITVGEDIEKGTLTVTIDANGGAIENMTLKIGDDDYDGEHSNSRNTWTFKNVEVSESGKIRLYVDIYDNTGYENKTLNLSIDGWNTFEYSNAGKGASKPDISGTLTISKLTLTPAEGTLKNNLSASDDVEFTNNETNTELVFDGTYTADKQDIKLNSFAISGTNNAANSKIKFYLYVGDMESSVAYVTIEKGSSANVSDSFNDVLVKAGESVRVKVEAEVDARELSGSLPTTGAKFLFSLDGEDENDNNAGHAEKYTSKIVIVKKGSVSVTAGKAGKAAKVVLRKASTASIAEFTVKPDGATSVTLESVRFNLNVTGTYEGEVKLTVGGSNKKLSNATTLAGLHEAEFSTNVGSEGVVVVVELDSEFNGEVELTDLYVNEKEIKKTYKKRFEEATVWFRDFSSDGDKTTIKFGVDKRDRDTVENVSLYYGAAWHSVNASGEIEDGKSYTFTNESSGPYDVTAIRYTINGGSTTVGTPGTPAQVTGIVASLTADAAIGDPFAEGWEYAANATSGSNVVVTLVQTTPAATDPSGSGITITGLTSGFIKVQGVADVMVLDGDSLITVQRDDYYDMFRKGMQEDGVEVYIAKAKS